MPIFEVTDPMGRTLEIEGDIPPTEAELDDIFSAVMPKQPSEKKPKNGALRNVAESTRGVLGSMASPFRTVFGAGESIGKAIGESESGPAALVGLAAAPLTGGLSVPASAAATATIAGGAEAYRQLARRAFTDEDLSSGEAAKKIGKTGLVAAASELGVTLPAAAFKRFGPTVLQVYDRIPAESIKRFITNNIPMAKDLKSAEFKGGAALARIQKKVMGARQESGKAVDEALRGLHAQVKGAEVVDLEPTWFALQETLENSGRSDPRVNPLANNPHVIDAVKKLEAIANEIAKSPRASPAQAVNIRRAIDEAIDFSGQRVGEPVSELAQRGAKAMRAALAKSLDDAGKAANYTKLSEANAAHHGMVETYEAIGEMVRTPSAAPIQMIRKFKRLANQFYGGGAEAKILENIGNDIPSAAKDVSNLLDAAAQRSMLGLPVGSPSGNVKDVGRMLMAPRVVGNLIRAGRATAPAARVAAPAVGLGTKEVIERR